MRTLKHTSSIFTLRFHIEFQEILDILNQLEFSPYLHMEIREAKKLNT